MPEQEAPACLIAAGGTAGHVLPALAVAEALVARGARVTFAGSPGRAEARLVPEGGYELDTFRGSGLPRQPGVAQARPALDSLARPAAFGRVPPPGPAHAGSAAGRSRAERVRGRDLWRSGPGSAALFG